VLDKQDNNDSLSKNKLGVRETESAKMETR